MADFKIEIGTGNAAFEDRDSELARILRELADAIEEGREPASVRDSNGNKVGKVTY